MCGGVISQNAEKTILNLTPQQTNNQVSKLMFYAQSIITVISGRYNQPKQANKQNTNKKHTQQKSCWERFASRGEDVFQLWYAELRN